MGATKKKNNCSPLCKDFKLQRFCKKHLKPHGFVLGSHARSRDLDSDPYGSLPTQEILWLCAQVECMLPCACQHSGGMVLWGFLGFILLCSGCTLWAVTELPQWLALPWEWVVIGYYFSFLSPGTNFLLIDYDFPCSHQHRRTLVSLFTSL